MGERIPVFIFAGQSNMKGVRTDVNARNIDGVTAVYEQDTNLKTTGPEYGFLRALEGIYDQMAVLKYAFGGAAVRPINSTTPDFSPDSDGELFDQLVADYADLITRLTAQGYEPVLEGVFWLQGEQEALNQSAALGTAAATERFIDALKAALDAQDVPFVIGEIADNPTRVDNVSIVQAQHQALADARDDVLFIDNSDKNMTDNAHFSAASHFRMGIQFAEAYTAFGAGEAVSQAPDANGMVPQTGTLGNFAFFESGDGRNAVQTGDTAAIVLTAGGDDEITGGAGADILFGEAGNDIINGGDGADEIWGGLDDDRLFGNAGDDFLYGETGDDFLWDTQGNNRFTGGKGNDFIQAGKGDDQLRGGEGDDILYAGNGDDILIGVIGNDTMYGQRGADVLNGGDGDDLLVGGAGADRVIGGEHDDRIFGNGNQDTLHGDGGDDFLNGGTGNDDLFGGVGDDTLIGRFGVDRLFDGAGDDLVRAGAGRDFLVNGDGNDRLYGEGGDDTFSTRVEGNVASNQSDVMSGGDGADRFVFNIRFSASEAYLYRCAIEDFDLSEGDQLFINTNRVAAEFSISETLANTLVIEGAAGSGLGRVELFFMDGADFAAAVDAFL